MVGPSIKLQCLQNRVGTQCIQKLTLNQLYSHVCDVARNNFEGSFTLNTVATKHRGASSYRDMRGFHGRATNFPMNCHGKMMARCGNVWQVVATCCKMCALKTKPLQFVIAWLKCAVCTCCHMFPHIAMCCHSFPSLSHESSLGGIAGS